MVWAGPDRLATLHWLKRTAINRAFEGGVIMDGAAGTFATSTQTIEQVNWLRLQHFQR